MRCFISLSSIGMFRCDGSNRIFDANHGWERLVCCPDVVGPHLRDERQHDRREPSVSLSAATDGAYGLPTLSAGRTWPSPAGRR